MSTTFGVWVNDSTEVLAFAHVLTDAGHLNDIQDALYFFEKPHKWEREHEIWNGCDRPTHGDEGWDWFLRKLDREESR
jgi:hypothetical protein